MVSAIIHLDISVYQTYTKNVHLAYALRAGQLDTDVNVIKSIFDNFLCSLLLTCEKLGWWSPGVWMSLMRSPKWQREKESCCTNDPNSHSLKRCFWSVFQLGICDVWHTEEGCWASKMIQLNDGGFIITNHILCLLSLKAELYWWKYVMAIFFPPARYMISKGTWEMMFNVFYLRL